MDNVSKKQVFFGFPGIGKTTFVKKTPGFIDLDYGYLRTAMGHTFGDDQSDVRKVMTKLAFMYATHGGYVIITNEPSLIPDFKQAGFDITVVIPASLDDVKTRLAERDGADGEFTRALQVKGEKWLAGWRQKAEDYQVPLLEVEFFEDIFKRFGTATEQDKLLEKEGYHGH